MSMRLLLLLLFYIHGIRAVKAIPECFFAEPRIHDLEKCPRPSYAEVSSRCDGERTRLSDLQKNHVSEHGALNQLELALGRGAAVFQDMDFAAAKKYSDKYICSKHLDELVRDWDNKIYAHSHASHGTGKTKTLCGIPDHGHDIILGTPRTRMKHLTKDMAHSYLVKNQMLLPIGLAICPDHTDLNRPVDTDSEKKDPTWKDTTSSAGHSGVSTEVASSFSEFAQKAGIRGACPATNFRSFAKDTKQRRVYALRKLNEIMLKIMAPGAEAELKEMFINSFSPRSWKDSSETKLRNILTEISEQYDKYTDRRSREIVLSVIADVLPYRELHNYLPGISYRRYYNAKRRAIRKVDIKEPVFRKHRFEPVRLGHFVEFITSSYVSIGLPHGERKVKYSDGSKTTVPNTLRLYRNAEIWRMYAKYMADRGKSHLMITESVAHAILKKCGATRRHALTCVDYFVAEGLDAFEDLDDMLDTLVKNALLDADLHKLHKHSLLRSKTYLRTDYRVHVKKESKVDSHCMLHSLSDTINNHFRYNGPAHEHDLSCPRCKQLDATFNDIKTTIVGAFNNMPASHGMKNELREMIIRHEKDTEKIFEMKKHFLRSVYTDQERDWLIASLVDGEGLLTLDWAQKHLPMWKWEDQRRYFGKKGMSYHISHVLVKMHGHYVQHSLVHVLYTTKQDNVAVSQIMGHVFETLADMGVKALHCRADNAGAYHSLGTIASIPSLAKKINIKSFSFSEPQNGKSSCDRVAAQVKRRVRDYVAARNTVADEKQFFAAIKQSELQGVSVYLATIQRGTEEEEKEAVKKLSPKIDGISELGHFKYDGKGNVRAWKFWGIGDGVEYRNLQGFTHKLKIEDHGGKEGSDEIKKSEEELLLKNENPKHFWLAYIKKEAKNEPDDVPTVSEQGEERNDANGEGLFVCKQCGASFILIQNLQRHVDADKHHRRPDMMTLYDHALKLYKEGLEEVIRKNNALDEVNEAMAELATSDGSDALEEGWALRGKRKSGRYSEKAKKFAEAKFNEGAASGRKMDPAEVERLMKEDLNILPSERMNAQQIKSYFSKLCSAKKKVPATRASRMKRSQDEDDCDDDLSEEDEEVIDEFGRQPDDVIDDIIHESHAELFTNYKDPHKENDD